VWLLRHASNRRAQDYIVGAGRAPLAVVRNASIAYALRMAAFIPLFAWGASGDLWPAIIASACFALGIGLVYVARRPLLAFVDDALARDRSVTVHEFIAKAHGNDPRVRRLAAGVTLCALFGLVVGEALAAAAFLEPMLKASAPLAALLVVAALLSIGTTAALSGHAGVMHSAQLQLGVLYFGLFAAACSCFTCTCPRARRCRHMSRWRSPSPPCSARSSCGTAVRDTSIPTRSAATAAKVALKDRARRARSQGSGRYLNGSLSVLLVLIVIVAIMDLNSAGGSGSRARASRRLRRERGCPAWLFSRSCCCRCSIRSSTLRTGSGLQRHGTTPAAPPRQMAATPR
jgi:hypothetical protein